MDLYTRAATDGARSPADGVALKRYGDDRTAVDVLRSAVYIIASFPSPSQVREALTSAASVAGAGVTAVVGALLGAYHGVDRLPVDLVSRLKLAWVADTLARDLVTEIHGDPGGRRTLLDPSPGVYEESWAEAVDPKWSNRYPGW